ALHNRFAVVTSCCFGARPNALEGTVEVRGTRVRAVAPGLLQTPDTNPFPAGSRGRSRARFGPPLDIMSPGANRSRKAIGRFAMAQEFDLVVRNGTVADGRGGPLSEFDVAVKDGRIAATGKNLGRGAEELDARGKLVTPGFVDIHTHYD